MKKALLLIFTIILLMCFSGCSGKKKELAQNTTKEFFDAIKNDNNSKMQELYPSFENIGAHYKSDEIVVKETKILEDKKISVTLDNFFTNGFGKKFNQEITLYLKPDENNDEIYRIFDSRGITDFKDKDEYVFAVKTGGIDKNTYLTDQEISQKLKIVDKMLVDYAIDILKELRSEIVVTSWNWEEGYGGSASGKGIVKNNSTFDVPELKYKIAYYDRNDNQITTDDGYVTYDKLSAGVSKSFTFYTSYVGNAQTARISLDFDAEMVLKYLIEKDYTGKEFEEFVRKNKDEN